MKKDSDIPRKKRRGPNASATVVKQFENFRVRFSMTPLKKNKVRELQVFNSGDSSQEEQAGYSPNWQHYPKDDCPHTASVADEKILIGYSGQTVWVELPDLRKDIVIVRWKKLIGDYEYWVRVQDINGQILENTPYTSKEYAHLSTKNLQKFYGKGVQITVFCINNGTCSYEYQMVGSTWFHVPKYVPSDFCLEDQQCYIPVPTKEKMPLELKVILGVLVSALFCLILILRR